MKHCFIIIILMVCAFNANAQTYLNHLQTKEAGKGKVTVKQSPELDKLINGEEKEEPKQTPIRQEDKTKAEHKEQAQQANTEPQEDITEETASVARISRKTSGYRVQVFAGGNSGSDKVKANAIGDAIRSRFPGHSVYVRFVSPRWICRMGNFKTREEAQEMLNRVKAAGYTQACLVKGTITVFE